MAFVINGQIIQEQEDYLAKGSRSRINSTMRSDLLNDYAALMKHIREPMSVGFDVMIELLSEDKELLDKFIKRCKSY